MSLKPLRWPWLSIGAAAAVLSWTPALHADHLKLDNGTLRLHVDNGTIDPNLNSGDLGTVSDVWYPLGGPGKSFFQGGNNHADFGFRLVGDGVSPFVAQNRNAGDGSNPFGVTSVTSNGSVITVTGSFSTGGHSFDFTRKYSLVPGFNAVKVEISLTKTNAGGASLVVFDTLNPNQGMDLGLGADTLNNSNQDGDFLAIVDPADATVAWATGAPGSTRTIAIGSMTSDLGDIDPGSYKVGVATDLMGRWIDDLGRLNQFLGSSLADLDRDGFQQDTGLNISWNFTFAGSGDSKGVTYYQSYDETIEGALALFGSLAAPVVPEPGSMTLMGLGGLGLLGLARRRAARPAQ